MTLEWYEVHSDDEPTDGHFHHECGELRCGMLGQYEQWDSLEQARNAAADGRESHPQTRIWIVRVVEEEVEDVPKTEEA
jgi:hypothetical protein